MQFDEAMHLYQEMPLRGLKGDIISFDPILQGLVQIERYTAAQEIFTEMQAAGLIPDIKTCGLVERPLQKPAY